MRQPSSVERLPAAAGRVSVGIADFEALAVKPVVKIDRGAVEVGETLGVHDDPDTLALERRVLGLSVRQMTSRTEDPEQPPCSTKRRRRPAGLGELVRMVRTWLAASV